jgi:hypothetical protein
MSDTKVINIDFFRPKGKPTNTPDIFNLVSTIKNCQNAMIEKTIELVKAEYEELLIVIKSNPCDPFYQRVRVIFENILNNPEYANPDDTYLLLLYYTKIYMPVIDIKMYNNDIEVTSHPRGDNEIMLISLLNVLLTNSKGIIDVRKSKPLDLLYQILALYEA